MILISETSASSTARRTRWPATAAPPGDAAGRGQPHQRHRLPPIDRFLPRRRRQRGSLSGSCRWSRRAPHRQYAVRRDLARYSARDLTVGLSDVGDSLTTYPAGAVRGRVAGLGGAAYSLQSALRDRLAVLPRTEPHTPASIPSSPVASVGPASPRLSAGSSPAARTPWTATTIVLAPLRAECRPWPRSKRRRAGGGGAAGRGPPVCRSVRGAPADLGLGGRQRAHLGVRATAGPASSSTSIRTASTTTLSV
jgi:hypothetical protein